jgi:hypothetical protein
MFSHGLVMLMAAADAVCGNGNVCETGLPNVDASHAQLQQILQIVFGIILGKL